MRRPWALPLVPLYAAGLGLKNAARDRAVGVRQLAWPVISVGSLSAGGAGKTPVVRMLAGLLRQHGLQADVLSRGFGRGSSLVEQVDPAGTAERFGDEPLEMARDGLRVFVGADRLEAGQLAEASGGSGIHLLDDGFQHRILRRGLDLVLLTLADVRDSLLPAGNLREPFRSLKRADVVLLRSEEAHELRPLVSRWTQAEVWLVDRHMSLPAAAPTRALAFCGIARPDNFFSEVTKVHVKPVSQMAFRDHHGYTRQDCQRLVAAAAKAGANGFITTAKDAVKLTDEDMQTLAGAGPIAVAQLQVSLVDEELAWLRLQGFVAAAPVP